MTDADCTDDEALFAELAIRYFDGVANAEEVAQLTQMLEVDEQRRDQFVWLSYQSRLLTHLVQSAPAANNQATIAAKESPRVARAPGWSPAVVAIVALAACALVALGVWQMWPSDDESPVVQNDPPKQASPDDPQPPQIAEHPPQPPTPVQLVHWEITPTGSADYHVVQPALVRLQRGELLVRSNRKSGQPELVVQTPAGNVKATGTKFYVGYHRPTSETSMKGTPVQRSSITRVLVLAGMVTLANSHGIVQCKENELATARADSIPAKLVVTGNSEFAIDLYQQLVKENKGENLFFSPYSISSALAMTAEGARGETADQMGSVLRFPGAAKRIGQDAQMIPWETALIHTGMAELNRILSGGNDDPAKTAKIRADIVELRDRLEAVKERTAKLRKQRKWKQLTVARKEEQKIVAELNKLSAQVDQYEIRVANALWGEKTYPFDPEYVNTIKHHYETGGIFPVDFRNAFEDVRLQINDWIEGQTNNRIKDLIPAGALDEYTRLVLTNAIYFKGEWSTPFKEDLTKDRDFTLTDGTKMETAIMYAPKLDVGRYGAFNADGSCFNTPLRIRHGQDPKQFYPKADGFAMVELPYKGGDLSMVVIAPNDPVGLAAIEEQLTSANLDQWIGQLKKRKTHVYLPKFKLETEYTLGDAEDPGTLQKMGMVRAFKDPRDLKTGAQFHGMTTSTDPMEQLYISKVLHKAFVEVNEKGTEAAAATAVIMMSPRSAPLDFPFTPEFKADRPFLFLIREKSTGSILFVGRMTKPTSAD